MGATTREPETIYRARREALTDPPLALNELARRIGMSGGILSLIERGRMVPTVAESEAILQALEAERRRRDEPSTLVMHRDGPDER